MLFEVRSTYVDANGKQLEDVVTRYSGTVGALNAKLAELMNAGAPGVPGSHMIAVSIALEADFQPIT